MSSAGDVLRLRESLSGKLDEREPIPQRFRATMGDGTGAVVVPGKGNYVYVRRLGRGLIEECLNNKAAARDGLPIIAGYSHESPDVLQVLEVDWYSFSAPGAYPYTQHHHEAHELHNVVGGDDVVWVQSQQLMPLLVYPTSPVSMFVNVFGGWYPWASGWHYFEPTLSADLTAHVPALVANARYVLISIDGATEALQYTAGVVFPIFMPPVDAENMVPAPPAGSIPIGAVYLPNGTATLDWDNLYDMRLFNQPVGGSITPGVHALLDTTVHSDTATDAPTRGSIIAGNATPAWDELVIGVAQKILKVNAGGTDPEWGEPPIASISGHVRGSIFRGEAADWAVYDAKTDKQILVGDGVDIASVPVTQDVALANTGAATVVGIQTRTVAAGAPADGQVYAWNNAANEWQVADQSGGGGGNPTFKSDGALIVLTNIDGAYVATGVLEIAAVYIHCGTTGTAGSTIVDVNKNGVTIFTVQANRPTLAWNDPDGVAKSGVPDVIALAENDVLTADIDQIATGAKDLSVIVALAGGGGGGGDSTHTSAYAARPAASNAGDLFLPSDGFVIERDTGAVWVPWGPIFPLIAPISGDFAWVNQNDTVLSTTKGGVNLTDPKQVNNNANYALRVKATPGLPYTITALFLIPAQVGVSFTHALLFGWRQTSDGKLVMFRLYWNTNWRYSVLKATNPTTDVADYVTLTTLLHPVPYLWVRIADDSTNRLVSISADGQNFIQLHSVGRTDYITPDQVLWGLCSRNVTYATTLTLLSWKEA